MERGRMLVLSRKRDEQIVIADNITITVIDIQGERVRLGIQAPIEIPIHRMEVYEAIQREKAKEASGSAGREPEDRETSD
jgi:carbon storage regulator